MQKKTNRNHYIMYYGHPTPLVAAAISAPTEPDRLNFGDRLPLFRLLVPPPLFSSAAPPPLPQPPLRTPPRIANTDPDRPRRVWGDSKAEQLKNKERKTKVSFTVRHIRDVCRDICYVEDTYSTAVRNDIHVRATSLLSA